MSDKLLASAEITKLGRLLNVSDADLAFLADLSPSALREFRERTTDLLFDGDAVRLKRVASAAKLVPAAISAKAAELAFGPLLCAALAGSVEPARAVAIAQKLPTEFLAETSIQLDPRRAAATIGAVPAQVVAEVGRELLKVGDHITMGRFVGVLPDKSLRAAAPIMGDADLLSVGFLLEDKSGMDGLLEIVADRLSGIIAAAHEHDLWAEAIDLLATVNTDNRARLGDITAQQSDEVLGGIIAAAQSLDAWDTLLPVTRAMSFDSLVTFSKHPAVHAESTLSAIVDVALNKDLWLDLLPLAAQLPPPQRAFIAAQVAEQTDERLSDLVRQADDADQWDAMILIAMAMDVAGRQRIFDIIDGMDDLDEFVAALTPETPAEVWTALVELRDEIPEKLRALLADRAQTCGQEDCAAGLRTTAG